MKTLIFAVILLMFSFSVAGDSRVYMESSSDELSTKSYSLDPNILDR